MNLQQQSALRNLMQNPGYKVMIDLANQVINTWDKNSSIGDDTFSTLKLSFMKEYKKQGLKDFLEALEREASQ